MDLNASCDLLQVSSSAHGGLSHLPGAARLGLCVVLELPPSTFSALIQFSLWRFFCTVFKEETKDIVDRIVVSLPLVAIN